MVAGQGVLTTRPSYEAMYGSSLEFDLVCVGDRFGNPLSAGGSFDVSFVDAASGAEVAAIGWSPVPIATYTLCGGPYAVDLPSIGAFNATLDLGFGAPINQIFSVTVPVRLMPTWAAPASIDENTAAHAPIVFNGIASATPSGSTCGLVTTATVSAASFQATLDGVFDYETTSSCEFSLTAGALTWTVPVDINDVNDPPVAVGGDLFLSEIFSSFTVDASDQGPPRLSGFYALFGWLAVIDG